MAFDPAVFLMLPLFLLSLIAREWARGWMAERCGDPTPREAGRRTLKPGPHVHLMGSLAVPAALVALGAPFPLGWARRTPVDPGRLRQPPDDVVRVALAAPLASLVLAIAFALVVRLAATMPLPSVLTTVALAGVAWNVVLALVHLLPLPPLDGAHIASRFMRLRHVVALHQLRPVLWLALILILVLPAGFEAARVPVRLVAAACLGLVGAPAEGLPL